MASKLKDFSRTLVLFPKSALFALTITALVLSSLFFFHSAAEAQLVCPQRLVEQITDEQIDDSDQPYISADGNLIAFRSEANFTGNNPDNNDEIFIYNATTRTFLQATDSTGANCSNPALSPDGSFLVYNTSGSVEGMPSNGIQQVYLYDINAGVTTKITNANQLSDQPILNGLNNQIVMRSEANLTGENPLNEDQIFIYDINSGAFNQITDAVLGITVFPSNNFLGNKIVFESSANLTGQNPVPVGIREIFLYDRDNDDLRRITANTAGSSGVFRGGAIDFSGNLINLAASGDPNGGGSNFPTGGRKIYLSDGNFPIPEITTSQDALAGTTAISGDGSCLVFTSSDNITGQNPMGTQQIFLYDIASDSFTQVGNFSGNTPRDPRVNEDCTKISFGRPVQQETSNVRQIYSATCFDSNAANTVPTLSEWGLIAMAGILGIVGLMVIARRKAAA